jgi:hypothetical protein
MLRDKRSIVGYVWALMCSTLGALEAVDGKQSSALPRTVLSSKIVLWQFHHEQAEILKISRWLCSRTESRLSKPRYVHSAGGH